MTTKKKTSKRKSTSRKVRRNPEHNIWIEGEPSKDGFYLVLVREQGKPTGNPWIFLAQVVFGTSKKPIYMDFLNGDNKYYKYKPGVVIAYCKPTGENFEIALKDIEKFYRK